MTHLKIIAAISTVLLLSGCGSGPHKTMYKVCNWHQYGVFCQGPFSLDEARFASDAEKAKLDFSSSNGVQISKCEFSDQCFFFVEAPRGYSLKLEQKGNQ